ncbi:MAG: DNA polymerase I [Burkholderiales bacterium]
MLLLVDGSSYLYRAFHALPDLRSPTGEPTGAVYGMIGMLRKLKADYQADRLACVFDAKGPTFRDAIFADYKAQRAPMPEDLVRQIEPIHALVRALGWPLLMVEGVEADDVIGTLASQAAAQGMETLISTGDKDLAQLVGPHVRLINTMVKPGAAPEVLDPPGVKAKFGVPPERIIDYLTLTGDAVDNVPGVDKVGPKTAAKWIAEYGSLEGVMANAASIKGAVGDNLRQALDWLPRGRELITVKCDVPGISLGDVEAQPTDPEALRQLFTRCGFRTWLRELEAGNVVPDMPDAAPALPADQPPKRYETILTVERLTEWIARLYGAPIASVDTETTGLDPLRARIVGISFAIQPYEAAYLPLKHAGPDAQGQLDFDLAIGLLKPWLEDPSAAKVGQNLKYDEHIFANHGIALAGIRHDTLLQSYVLESHKSHDMDSLAARHLGRTTILFEDVAGKGASQIGFEQVAIDRATEYSAEDAEVTLQLHQTLWPRIERDPGLARIYAIEVPVARVLKRVERNGVLIDAALLDQQGAELGNSMLALEKQAYELAGGPFNLGSPKQIGEIFFERMHLPVVKKTPSGAPSTDEEVLQKLAENYPLPKVLLEYRGLSKLKSTYTDKLPRMVNPSTGRVHTNYAQAVAVTGRLASNDPNLQNIPIRSAEGRRIREAFVAPPGSMILSADYSQIELRIMAHLSRDPALGAAFAAGLDVHRATAAEIFGGSADGVTSEQRRYAKVINFGLIYGMSAFGLAANLGIEREAAKNYIDRYFERFAGVKRYMDETRVQAREKGYVETAFGRRLWLPEIASSNMQRRQGAERAAINAPMQGTAADLIKLAMLAVQDWLDADQLGARLIMQVHDELVLEVPEEEVDLLRVRVPEIMAGVAQLAVPLVADVGVGKNWDQAH